jgi:LysM repeat protein
MARSSAPAVGGLPAVAATATVCPYLLADDGTWRASTPSKDHRCTAVVPAAVLTADKQRRLCLVVEHVDCATFQAAAERSATLHPDGTDASMAIGRRTGRAVARTTPVVLDRGGIDLRLADLRDRPRIGQLILIGLLGLAFAAILFARLPVGGTGGSGGGAAGGASASPRVTAAAGASATETATVSAEPSAAAGENPARTLVPTEVEPTPRSDQTDGPTTTPKPSVETTYKVKSGDTLSGIASVYGTTWQVLAELNGIKDPARLRVGQVLQLP